ncbi:MAG: serine/threonine-protein kinase [Gemmataceae bacterium]
MLDSQLGTWRLEQEIGRGGMGTVYLARRTTDGDEPAEAAIKVLAAELAVDLGFQQRFQREIDILRQLHHPNIVRFLESGVQDGRYWYAMELIDGRSFEDIRLEGGRLPWREVLELAWQIAPALKHAHDRGVIHRDIKPSNLLQDPEACVKLTDFGVASLFASPHLTVTGGVIGTPEYLSPEQAAGKPVTKRSDLYSLGVVLYTLVTGTTPFVGEPVDLLHKHQYGQFDRPSRHAPDLHPDFEEIIRDLLEKDPARRPPDAAVLFKRLDRLRNKLARQTQPGKSLTQIEGTLSAREGPATLMSRLMRQELEAQNRPGFLLRILNHPFILVTLFLLCVGTLVTTFWPSSAEGLYTRGAALMQSEQPDAWETAWDRYFEPLEARFPDHPYGKELAEFRRKLEDHRAEQRAEGRARWNRRLGEGEWFFEEGMRLRQRGDEEGARQVWTALIAAYADIPLERPWVRRAQKELDRQELPPAAPTSPSLEEALARARQLDDQGNAGEAASIRQGLRALYRGDPWALRLIDK